MRLLFQILLFMVLFNISSVMIAATGFFGENVLYSDIVSKDTNELEAPEVVLENLWTDPVSEELPGFKLGGFNMFSWSALTAGIIGLCLVVGTLTHNYNIIAAGVIGSIFLLMFTNSKKIFESIAGDLGPSAPYVVLMLGVTVFFIVLVTIVDYLSGQRSTK